MQWVKEFKHKIATLILTITMTTAGTAGIIFSCSGEVKTDDIFKNNKKVSAGDKNVKSLRLPMLTKWQVNGGKLN